MNSTAEEDLKHIGFFGTFNHTFKTIFKHKKLFTQITLTLILPLTLIVLAHMQISNRFFWKFENSILPYDSTYRFNHQTAIKYLYFFLFEIIYFTILTVFSLLSTSAVVFTVACSYSDRDVTFRQLIKIVVPNVWRKLFVTFVYIYLSLFIYNLLSGVVFYICGLIFGYAVIGSVIQLILLISYVFVFLYLTVVWQVASVVTVLEDVSGWKSMKKSKGLLYGKKKVGMGIGLLLFGILLGLMFVYELFVEYGDVTSRLVMIWRVVIGVLCVVFVMWLFLVMVVSQTVLYLVCKSYHGEVVDTVGLQTFLSGYTAETVVVPKPGEEIQLGRVQTQTPAQMV